MEDLSSRQRAVLRFLLGAQRPVSTAELAAELDLTPRQVSYCLKQLVPWLAERGCGLITRPGVGITVEATTEQRHALNNELGLNFPLRYVHTAEQRQQLLALLLTAAAEPYILHQLQQITGVSRSTVLADLDAVEAWLRTHQLRLDRRRNYGFSVEGAETRRRQALAAWLWGHLPWPNPVVRVNHQEGLYFGLSADPTAPPMVAMAQNLVQRCNPRSALRYVAELEASLGGRFSDDGALFLALVLAVQGYRLATRHPVALPTDVTERLRSVALWPGVEKVGRRLAWTLASEWRDEETAYLTMYVLATPRTERWPGDLESQTSFEEITQHLMQRIAGAFGLANLAHDATLRDGLLLHLVPAYYRRVFDLWFPPMAPAEGPRHVPAHQHRLAYELALEVHSRTGVMIPMDEVENIAMLLEAALIRERPAAVQQILVVCPSGMATAQLLVARLKARFPHMGTLVVRSLRQLTAHDMESADLVITTLPLPEHLVGEHQVIQVHPSLPTEDVQRITYWLQTRSHK
ncbi:MAG: hypothetical protein NZ528_11755 [Caldilineales bacterium]|nr:hypothetical protein [Caldilineales bacterium]MDW8317038.1 hypothetical protein [Anaerolineae bacterium]